MTNSNQNGHSSDRFDRIESVLERITDRLEQVSEAGQRTDERLDRLSAGQQQTDARLEHLSERLDQVSQIGQQTDARLDRVGERLDQVSQSGQRTDARLERIAAAVQDERIQRAEDYNELRNAIALTNQRLNAFITENRSNWERYEQQKVENDSRFNNLLADARADREEMRRQQETFQQAMERNQRDHEEFRAAIRSLLDLQSEGTSDND